MAKYEEERNKIFRSHYSDVQPAFVSLALHSFIRPFIRLLEYLTPFDTHIRKEQVFAAYFRLVTTGKGIESPHIVIY